MPTGVEVKPKISKKEKERKDADEESSGSDETDNGSEEEVVKSAKTTPRQKASAVKGERVENGTSESTSMKKRRAAEAQHVKQEASPIKKVSVPLVEMTLTNQVLISQSFTLLSA